ncbi:acyl-CoA thioesterase [Psychrobacter sp. FDAARGOS_221]|uniref:acyl-CoA thioesterase n=1 Tax=Psychrobacter sp. FDAARGOS_221 TaxID=1975705 RepID=UPI000BB54308|nr:acyl-CoA thioesterase [Psychrobacter sp. FDAARGOS_221]PNK60886.1 acyl-CoA thioesterase [Psychrobacter sp. FDAARGOS_221]
MSSSQNTMNTANDFDTPEALQHFPSIYVQPVIWNDMDAFNHVNNVVYYRYAESARINYLFNINAFSDEVTTVLAQSSCTYLRPVTFPDTLLIGVRTKKLGNSSIVMEYCYYSTAQQAVVATGDSALVRLNQDATAKVTWSETERNDILAFEQSVGHTPES